MLSHNKFSMSDALMALLLPQCDQMANFHKIVALYLANIDILISMLTFYLKNSGAHLDL